MNQRFFGRILLAIFISVLFIACKGKGNGEETEIVPDTANAVSTADMDAVKVAPGIYKVLTDTLGIRMLEVSVKPGDSAAMHWHPDYAVYVTEGGMVTFYAKDGSKMDNEMPSGATLIRPAETHGSKNSGSTNIKAILFEVNRTGLVTSPDAAMDATKIAPGIYKLKNDTLGIRVIEVVAAPGQKIAMHSHPDNALYITESGTAEFTDKEGKKTVVELTKGMSLVGPAESHSVVNTGKTTVKGILVEVYRAMK